MSKVGNKMQFTRLYDHVLSELEFGRTEIGINLLVGMLDGAELRISGTEQARDELREHPLNVMLLEDPLNQPSDLIHRVNMLNQQGCGAAVSSTGRRLFAVTSEITFARALRQRAKEAERKLKRALRLGQKIWLIVDPQSPLTASLGSVDPANIRVSSEYEIRLISADHCLAQDGFDLILAPNLPDFLSGRGVRQLTSWLGAQLSEHGVLVTSAVMPGHPGTGWRRACFNWEPNCHDDAAIAKRSAPGFTTHSHRDETGCIAWVETRRA